MAYKFKIDQVVIVEHRGNMPAYVLSVSPEGENYSIFNIMNKQEFYEESQLRLATDEECQKYDIEQPKEDM